MSTMKPETATQIKPQEGDAKKGIEQSQQQKDQTGQQRNDQTQNLRGGFRGRGRGGYDGGRGGFDASRGGRGRFDGSRGRGGGRPFDGRPQAQDGSQNNGQNQQTQGQGQTSDDQNQGRRGGYRGGFRGGRGGAGGGERREKIVHPPPQFTEDGERMFTGRCRLFVGNLPQDMTQEEFEKMFEPFGQFQEAFISAGRGFGFIRMDTRQHAVSAKKALDGEQKKGRFLRVRFASHAAAIKVKHLNQYVSNELLEEAFSTFGEIEKATVIIDDKGRPTGEGIVEYARKPGATMALNRINEGVFLLGSSLRPVVVAPLIENDEEDGLPEKFMQKNADYMKEREQGARLAPVNSFEYEFGLKWKEMYMMHNEAEENLKRQFQENVAKLEIEQANAQMEYQTRKLREDLVRRQEELRKMEESHQREMQLKMEMRRNQEENRRKMEEMRKREEEENRLKMERFQQQQDNRSRQQQEIQMRELQEMRQMREELSQMRQQTRQLKQRKEEEMQGGGSGMMNIRDQGDVPAMKPPPAPPAAVLQLRGGQDIPSLMDVSGRGESGGQRGNMDRGGRPDMDRMNNMGQNAGNNMGQNMGQNMNQNMNQNMGQNMGGGMVRNNMGGGGMRQSRFEQGSGNGFSQGGMGGIGNNRNMDRRDRPEDFYDAKRARRF